MFFDFRLLCAGDGLGWMAGSFWCKIVGRSICRHPSDDFGVCAFWTLPGHHPVYFGTRHQGDHTDCRVFRGVMFVSIWLSASGSKVCSFHLRRAAVLCCAGTRFAVRAVTNAMLAKPSGKVIIYGLEMLGVSFCMH